MAKTERVLLDANAWAPEASTFRGSGLTRALSWLAYPSVIAIGLGLYLTMVRAGIGVRPSSYVAVAVGTLLIVLLEGLRPHRDAWRADRVETWIDLAYLVGVQMILPIALGLGLGALLAHRSDGTAVVLWPRTWPLVAQFFLLLTAADFLRYWLHVGAHRYEPLWRLHAIHHAPDKLHALNVGRFHPLERICQYLLEVVPFVLLGVEEQVLALYFLFHSLHGFFQHANVDARLGALNYVLCGPELHRWHHSQRATESNANYGNHLAVWDLVFDTYFRPRERTVGRLGLHDERDSARCEATVDRVERMLDRGRTLAVNRLLHVRMAAVQWLAWRPLVAAAKDPRRAQLALLRRILARNRDTAFGRDHGFASIASYDDYRARVDVQTYESLRPAIEAQERTGRPHLTRERPIRYAETSGTTGTPKYVPLTRRTLAQLRRSQSLFSYLQYRALPAAFRGHILAVVSPAIEGVLPTGTPFGSVSGHLYASMPRLARSKYVVPPAVFTIADYGLKYLLILRLALADAHITAMGAANPSTLLKLLDTLQTHRRELVADLESNRFSRADELDPAVRSAIASRLRCSRARTAEVRRLLARERPTIAELWPGLALVTTWSGGSAGIALARLRTTLPPSTHVVELGYLASECRGSLTFDVHANLGLPTLCDNFFEFVAKERWDRGEPEFLTIERLEVRGEYYVFITTSGGLYRYAMNDIVRVTGRFHATPTIAFVQKGKGVTSITGEKLYEGQVIDAVRRAEAELGVAARFFVMIADVARAEYRLLIERDGSFAPDPDHLAARVDRLLASGNVEYRQKRASGRLGALVVRLAPAGFGEAYKAWCVARGQREGQFKTIALQYASDFGFDDGSGVVDGRRADQR